MVGLLFGLVVLVAAAVWVTRGLARRAARRRALAGPGGSLERAIPVHTFDEIDRTVAAWRCACGTRPRLAGEGARSDGQHRYRVARLACDACEEETVLWFDVSAVLH